ncbi:MAG: hypothetical protein ABMB14_11870 [Myxococcota bacterium]
MCLREPAAIEPAARVVVAASSGLPVATGTTLEEVLGAVSPPELRLLIVDARAAKPGSLDVVTSVCPRVTIGIVHDQVDEGLLGSALRLKSVAGVIHGVEGRMRHWELGFLVRRLLAAEAPPLTRDLLCWGASTRAFTPKSARERALVPRAVDVAAGWYGVSAGLASQAAEAAEQLFAVPKIARSKATLELVVDPRYVALELIEPTGALTRSDVYGAVVHGSVLDGAMVPERNAVWNLFRSATILRFEVEPGRRSIVSWILDRGPRAAKRSLFYLETGGSDGSDAGHRP